MQPRPLDQLSQPVHERGRRALTLSGALLLSGLVVNGIQRMLLHPSGAEDDHEAIFSEYAESDAWVATHFAEFVLVLDRYTKVFEAEIDPTNPSGRLVEVQAGCHIGMSPERPVQERPR